MDCSPSFAHISNACHCTCDLGNVFHLFRVEHSRTLHVAESIANEARPRDLVHTAAGPTTASSPLGCRIFSVTCHRRRSWFLIELHQSLHQSRDVCIFQELRHLALPRTVLSLVSAYRGMPAKTAILAVIDIRPPTNGVASRFWMLASTAWGQKTCVFPDPRHVRSSLGSPV